MEKRLPIPSLSHAASRQLLGCDLDPSSLCKLIGSGAALCNVRTRHKGILHYSEDSLSYLSPFIKQKFLPLYLVPISRLREASPRIDLEMYKLKQSRYTPCRRLGVEKI
jgi:hypothetical protein